MNRREIETKLKQFGVIAVYSEPDNAFFVDYYDVDNAPKEFHTFARSLFAAKQADESDKGVIFFVKEN